MITFICCSINPTYSSNLENNIKDTIGDIPFEFIAFDNREVNMGICEVYNNCAMKSKYDYLCFLHEDVKFLTYDWGATILMKLQEEDCGCIGFAGSILKMAYPSGWFVNGHNTRNNYRQLYTRRKKNPSFKVRNPDNCDYSEVVTLDGMALFVSKHAWNKCKFDQESLKGFHCYDIDFTINLANSGFKNYVSNLLLIEHFSEGSFSKHWRDETLANFDKWKHVLPIYASNISKKCRLKHYPKVYYNSIKIILEHDLYSGVPKQEISDHIKKYPLELSSWKLLRLYSKYKSRYEPN